MNKDELFEIAQTNYSFVLDRDSVKTHKKWADYIALVYDVVNNERNKAIYDLLKGSNGTVSRDRVGTVRLTWNAKKKPAKQVSMYNLVYIVNGKVKETIETNKSYSICKYRASQLSITTHKIGLLQCRKVK